LRLQDASFRAMNKFPVLSGVQHVSRCSAIE
jgi:hypothetical protein